MAEGEKGQSQAERMKYRFSLREKIVSSEKRRQKFKFEFSWKALNCAHARLSLDLLDHNYAADTFHQLFSEPDAHSASVSTAKAVPLADTTFRLHALPQPMEILHSSAKKLGRWILQHTKNVGKGVVKIAQSILENSEPIDYGLNDNFDYPGMPHDLGHVDNDYPGMSFLETAAEGNKDGQGVEGSQKEASKAEEVGEDDMENAAGADVSLADLKDGNIEILTFPQCEETKAGQRWRDVLSEKFLGAGDNNLLDRPTGMTKWVAATSALFPTPKAFLQYLDKAKSDMDLRGSSGVTPNIHADQGRGESKYENTASMYRCTYNFMQIF
eukprot:g10430.t1